MITFLSTACVTWLRELRSIFILHLPRGSRDINRWEWNRKMPVSDVCHYGKSLLLHYKITRIIILFILNRKWNKAYCNYIARTVNCFLLFNNSVIKYNNIPVQKKNGLIRSTCIISLLGGIQRKSEIQTIMIQWANLIKSASIRFKLITTMKTIIIWHLWTW